MDDFTSRTADHMLDYLGSDGDPGWVFFRQFGEWGAKIRMVSHGTAEDVIANSIAPSPTSAPFRVNGQHIDAWG
ncbi:hypothetical protein [Crateriforma conspicua]|uniref:hypothetical protein n=1 Tax=Crateriforma conspicua TaxID=2527996 RepID=UPI001188E130|nr:hypothetical protein [Crateriforma conspicua]QDV62761.1 hypothetical protein Mal65_18970 [Crateriforma conspicua]